MATQKYPHVNKMIVDSLRDVAGVRVSSQQVDPLLKCIGCNLRLWRAVKSLADAYSRIDRPQLDLPVDDKLRFANVIRKHAALRISPDEVEALIHCVARNSVAFGHVAGFKCARDSRRRYVRNALLGVLTGAMVIWLVFHESQEPPIGRWSPSNWLPRDMLGWLLLLGFWAAVALIWALVSLVDRFGSRQNK